MSEDESEKISKKCSQMEQEWSNFKSARINLESQKSSNHSACGSPEKIRTLSPNFKRHPKIDKFRSSYPNQILQDDLHCI